jgi:type IV pilus assembly protein PilA
MKKMNNKGFSLIELIIVIAIMAVLVAVIAPNLTGYIGKSKENADKSNADTLTSTISNALQDFVTDDTMGYAKAAPEADISSAANALTKMKTVNDLLSAASKAEKGSFLKNVENSLAKYISGGKIDPKVKANEFAMTITGTYDDGFSCTVTAKPKSSTTTTKK